MSIVGVATVADVHSRPMKKIPSGTEMSPVAMAIAQIGGTMEEVAKKVGVSRRQLFRLRDAGTLDPKRVPHGVVCKFVELSGLKKELLIGDLKPRQAPRAR